MTFFNRLRDYFQNIADVLAGDKAASSIFPNPVDAGTSREDILFDFLIRHVPARCEVIKGGFIFNSDGNESKQIDILVTNDLTLQFRQFDKGGQQGKSFNCIEGCYAAISVKTMLDKKNLIDSLENIASIPPMPDMHGKLNPSLTNPQRFYELPYKVVFAFDGIAPETLISYINEFYSGKKIHQNRYVNIFIVNRKYVVIYSGTQWLKTASDGTPLPPFTFVAFNPPYVGAMSLLHLLSRIQECANFGSQILMDFGPYMNKISFTETK
jgi:hypothetical protein